MLLYEHIILVTKRVSDVILLIQPYKFTRPDNLFIFIFERVDRITSNKQKTKKGKALS